MPIPVAEISTDLGPGPDCLDLSGPAGIACGDLSRALQAGPRTSGQTRESRGNLRHPDLGLVTVAARAFHSLEVRRTSRPLQRFDVASVSTHSGDARVEPWEPTWAETTSADAAEPDHPRFGQLHRPASTPRRSSASSASPSSSTRASESLRPTPGGMTPTEAAVHPGIASIRDEVGDTPGADLAHRRRLHVRGPVRAGARQQLLDRVSHATRSPPGCTRLAASEAGHAGSARLGRSRPMAASRLAR